MNDLGPGRSGRILARVAAMLTALPLAVAAALVTALVPALASTTPAGTDVPTIRDRAAESAGVWVWPLQPRPEVVRPFDPPDDPWGSGHRGVDLLGRKGQAVRAAGAGTVTYAGMLAGRGVVAVTHGRLRTTYEPVRASVHKGDHVDAAQPIGRLRAGGHCTPRVCLHWGLLDGSEYLDPLSLVAAGPPRLLPLTPARTGRQVAGSPADASPVDASQVHPPRASGGPDGSAAPDGPSPGEPGGLRSGGPADPDRSGAGTGHAAGSAPTTIESSALSRSRLVGLTAPLAGAVSGALVAGFLVRCSRAREPAAPSPEPPAPAGPAYPAAHPGRFGAERTCDPVGGTLIDLDEARRRPRRCA